MTSTPWTGKRLSLQASISTLEEHVEGYGRYVTSSGVDDLHPGGGPLPQDGVLGVPQHNGEVLVILLQAVGVRVDAPRFPVDSCKESGRLLALLN